MWAHTENRNFRIQDSDPVQHLSLLQLVISASLFVNNFARTSYPAVKGYICCIVKYALFV